LGEEADSVLVAALSFVVFVTGGVAEVVFTDEVTSFVSSEVALRNSRIALPAAEPSSGKRPGPKMISTITSRATIQRG
jgi:hypothetical protein